MISRRIFCIALFLLASLITFHPTSSVITANSFNPTIFLGRGTTAFVDAATNTGLVTFGLKPDRPATGYGCIRAAVSGQGPFSITEFVEKPSLPVAQGYLSSGDYLWNSGIFLFSGQAFCTDAASSRRTLGSGQGHRQGHH